VAGIAAAVGNNGIGIAGVYWNAKILPIKVFQSSGRGDAATIAKGVNYAANKGATVINMSFGSYSESLTLKNALASAYATAVLVAAAGNDGLCIGPGLCPDKQLGAPLYPGAYSFVLGVEAPPRPPVGFTNYDQDGPVFSGYADLLNYELKAPGTGIISCVPGGNYREYNGTSMAAPLVAGAVSLYHKSKPNDNQELMWGNLINTSGLNFNLEAAINIDPKPVLSIVKYQLADTLSGGDWDWKADAGETILLNVTVRNSWGSADSVYVGVKFQEFEDTTTAIIEKSTALIGAIGPYASLSNWNNQLQIKIQPNVSHDRDIQFVLQTWKGYKKEYLSEQKTTIRVEHGTELKGVLEDTLRLTPDKYWLVSNSFKIGPTGVLILNPGTEIKVERQISNNGKIFMEGIKNKRITYNGPSGITGGTLIANFVDFVDLHSNGSNSIDFMPDGNYENCIFRDFSVSYRMCYNGNFINCIISNGICSAFSIGASFKYCNIYSINPSWGFFWEPTSSHGELFNTNFYDIKGTLLSYAGTLSYAGVNTIHNVNFLGSDIKIMAIDGTTFQIPSNYWGTTDSLKIEDKLFHFWDESNRALIKYQPLLIKPSTKAHACVWKVVVNGKDAQDEFKYLDPLGVAIHKFEVYFNRPMNIQFPPTVTMGVREPYNQVTINENGSWSTDSLIYTVYKNLSLTANNGLNRIKVVNGKDIEDFDLVPESERFNVNIQTTASASLDFMATPSLGKVNLEWNNNDLADGLGFNMYRMENINDSTLTKSILINKTLIADTLYTDFSVTPNKKYYYYYKIVRTDLSETDSSRVVSATPFTASKGDANGDLSVNVLDITTIVAYLLNNNPQPFITEAADMNSDGNINVLDIVGVVNQVLYGGLRSTSTAEDQQVSLYLQNDTLFADASTAIGGLQFDVNGVTSINDIQVLDALQAFESGYSQRDSSTLRLLYYSMSGKSIAAGNRIPLLKLKKGCILKDVIVSDKAGALIPVSLSDPTIGNRNNQGMTVAELGQNYPNPSKGQTTLPVQIFEKVDEATISIYNMLGQQVKVLKLDNPTVGKHELPWNSLKDKGLFIYKLEIRIGSQQFVSPLKKMIVL